MIEVYIERFIGRKKEIRKLGFTDLRKRWQLIPPYRLSEVFFLRGIYIEVIKPIGFRLAPPSVREAKELRIETLPPALIRGTRGRAAMNVDSVASALVSLG